MAKVGKNEFKSVKLRLIDPPRDITRMEISDSEIAELAQSIEEKGLLQPILLNEDGERYEIVAGHRRFLAVKSLNRGAILAKIVRMDPEQVGLARAVENLQRANLTPVEEGIIYTNLALAHGMSNDEIAKRMGKSAGVVRRRQDILTMPDYLQQFIHHKAISLSVAEELMSCSDKAHRQYLAEMAAEHGVTKEVARMWVSDWRKTLRGSKEAGGGGGLERSVMEPEIIYRPCDVCKGPVDINEMREMRMCTDCHENLTNAMKRRSKNET